MKKLLAVLLALVLVLSIAACGKKEEPKTDEPVVSEEPKQERDRDTLVVGTPEITGDFIWDFGNSSYDRYVKNLTGGYYGTIETTPAGELVFNDVVLESYETETDADGNKTYTFKIFDDLKWNDGSPITAADYVFSMLVGASREWAEVGASSSAGDFLVGYNEYHTPYTKLDENDKEVPYDGDLELVDYFAGVKLLGDYEFSLTIDKVNLPYFYESSAVSVGPLAMESWIPGASIETTEEGSKITGVDDLLAALERVSTEERFAPTVTCGPYKFVSFENQIVTLTVNENFKGDLDGELPKFKNIVIKSVNTDTDVEQVIAGELDLVTGVIEGAKIEAAKASDTAELNSYLRAGYGFISMPCDWGPTVDPNVRWGMASLIDRSEVLDYVLGGYGGTVNAEYGYAQWMYQERQAEIEEQLKPISFSIDAANEFFDQTEWKFEADGKTPFDKSKANSDGTYLRHNAKGDVFTIHHLGTDKNEVTDIIEIQYMANAPLAGLKFDVEKSDFDKLLDHFYYGFKKSDDDRYYNSFNLATGFNPVFDPYYSNHSAYLGTWMNSNQLSDPELDELIVRMRSVDPEEKDTYADIWVEYQVRINELMPTIPLYSNEYFDVYSTRITGVETTPFSDFAMQICKVRPAD
ncbi:MAG: ABC transporter substrate-binding protein [Ruminococcaceae bacterium]|nr:ABC transporter substrate-binding protein [Oscillospiraceae bacterium]